MSGNVVANKLELARLLKWSRPTLDDFLAKYPDAPVLLKGSTGVEWEFDPVTFVAFVKEIEVKEAAAVKAHSAALAQFSLFEEDETEKGLTPQQRLTVLRALQLEDELRVQRNQLLVASEVREASRLVWRTIGKELDAMPALIGREFNLPEPVVRGIKARFDEMRHRAVSLAQKLLKAEDERGA